MIKLQYLLFKKRLRFLVIVAILIFISAGMYFLWAGAYRLSSSMYANVEFDYIFSSCSYEQLNQYNQLPEFEKIVPWKAFSDMQLDARKKKVTDVGMLVLDVYKHDYSSTLATSFFSNDRVILKGKVNKDSIMIDKKIAEELDVTIGDKISFELEVGNKITKSISGIYENTTFVGKYMAIVFNTGKVNKSLINNGDDKWLSGAFVKVSNKMSFEKYIKENPYYPEQYFVDSTSDMSASQKVSWNETMRKKNWNRMVYSTTSLANAIETSSIYNSKNINVILGVMFGIEGLLLFKVIVDFLEEKWKVYHILNILGYKKRKMLLWLEHDSIICFLGIWIMILLATNVVTKTTGLYIAPTYQKNITIMQISYFAFVLIFTWVNFSIRLNKGRKK